MAVKGASGLTFNALTAPLARLRTGQRCCRVVSLRLVRRQILVLSASEVNASA